MIKSTWLLIKEVNIKICCVTFELVGKFFGVTS